MEKFKKSSPKGIFQRLTKQVFVLFLVMLGCDSKSPQKLVNGFFSYQTQNEVRKVVGSDIEFFGNIDGLSKARVNHIHLSENGKFGFIFFENKLAAVGFYPKDTLSYLNKMIDKYGVSMNNSFIYNGIEIQRGYDHEIGSIGGFYISWSDPELVKKYKNKVW